MYMLDEFGEMIADKGRFEAYAGAIHRAVRPGDVVVDVGCGPGIFALLACRAGARRVYAIDAGDALPVARRLAAANGLSDRIEFLHGDSRQMQLPERANVIVSDVRGALPLFGETLPSIEDARERFLLDGGTLIPRLDTIYVAVVETPDYYKRLTSPWNDAGQELNLTPALPLILNSISKTRFRREQLLTDAQIFCTLDYTQKLKLRPGSELRFRATRNGIGHGIAAWFETKLFEDIGFSTAPGIVDTVYGQGFLPWLEPVELEAKQELEIDLRADPVGGDYVWRWETRICAHHALPQKIFSQSTFEGAQFSPETLRRSSVDYVPVLSETGEAERWLLQAIDGNTPLQEIARGALERFPGVFYRQDEAFRRLSALVEKFSR